MLWEKGPAAALLHEITEKNTAREIYAAAASLVHAVGEQAERKLIRSDQSHVQDEASGAGLTLCASGCGGGGDAHSQSHKVISSTVVVAAHLKIITPRVDLQTGSQRHPTFRLTV